MCYMLSIHVPCSNLYTAPLHAIPELIVILVKHLLKHFLRKIKTRDNKLTDVMKHESVNVTTQTDHDTMLMKQVFLQLNCFHCDVLIFALKKT